MRKSEKIFYDLKESNIYIDLFNSRIYFSSSFNKERFIKGYQAFIKEEEDKLIAKYKVSLSLRFYLMLAYYIRIEKRGFYILQFNNVTGNYDTEIKRDYICFTEIEV